MQTPVIMKQNVNHIFQSFYIFYCLLDWELIKHLLITLMPFKVHGTIISLLDRDTDTVIDKKQSRLLGLLYKFVTYEALDVWGQGIPMYCMGTFTRQS